MLACRIKVSSKSRSAPVAFSAMKGMALHGVLVTAKLCEPTCMTEMNGICEQWYDATVGPPCRPAAALTIAMMATWLSTIVAVLVIVAKGLLGSKAKRA